MISNEDIVIDCLSDVHFFNKRTKPIRMLEAIRRLYPDNEETAKISILAVTGDYFDHLVSFNDPAIYYPMEAARHLLHLCKKNGIILRILEGTNFHDRKQNQLFDIINRLEGIGVDLKYVDTLSIEYIERYDINVLYLPDEWTTSAELTYRQAVDLIHSRGLEKVDVAFVHGGCTYQLPGIASASLHDACKWSELVSLAVMAGHIHTHSRYLNWISVGSLERLGHGEEGLKGVLRMTYRNGKEIDYERRINHKARVYKTLSVMGHSIGDIIAMIDEDGEIVKGSAVRLEFAPEDPAAAILDAVRATFPDLDFTEIKTGKKKSASIGSTFTQKRYEFKPITPASIRSLLNQRWRDEKTPSDKIDNTLSLLDELVAES